MMHSLFSEIPGKLYTSVLVVSETYSWFLHRMGEESARVFHAMLADVPRLTILEATLDHHGDVMARLERLRGRKLTYVDASSLVWLSDCRISTVWGTDHHLAMEGARVIPGLPSP